jgi:hypothetical protein
MKKQIAQDASYHISSHQRQYNEKYLGNKKLLQEIAYGLAQKKLTRSAKQSR